MKKVLLTVVVLCIGIFYGSLRVQAANEDVENALKDKLSIGIFMNLNYPTGDLDDAYDSAFAGGIKVGYSFTEKLGAELGFQRHSFDGNLSEDLSIDCLRLNLLYNFEATETLFPYFTAGVGYYMPDEGDDDIGVVAGIGLTRYLVELNKMIALDFSANYHVVFSHEDYNFADFRAGVNFNY